MKQALAIVALLALASPAQARHWHHHRGHHHGHHYSDARPRAWCGWFMRQRFGGGPEYNLARNWARRGHPTSPHVGAIVVWRHHVGLISGLDANGNFVITSGNDGHRVRTRVRPISNAIAFREI